MFYSYQIYRGGLCYKGTVVFIPPLLSRTAAHIPGVVSTVVSDGPFKVFCGGLPTYLTDDQVNTTTSFNARARTVRFEGKVTLYVRTEGQKQF